MTEAAAHPAHGSGGISMRLLSEAGLSRRITRGDERAFGELFRRNQQGLYGFCVSILGNPEDAADALQNTMAKALKSLPGDRREIKVKPWLYRVARNECVDILRGRRDAEDIDEHAVSSATEVEGSVLVRERLRQLLSDLDQLPERQRAALVMRELNGLGFKEIGSAMETSSAAAKQLVYEARCALEDQDRGREMSCDLVRRAISERDGRVLAGRRIRAHLRSCEACADFKAGIEARRGDLRLLVPPIPAGLALSIADLLGGPGGGGGLAALLGVGGGKAALSGGAMKAVAVVTVTAGVGAGTVGIVEGTKQARDHAPVVREAPQPGPVLDESANATLPHSRPVDRGAPGSVPVARAGGRQAREGDAGTGRPRHRPARPSPGFQGRRDASPPVVNPATPGPFENAPGGSGGAQRKGAVPSPGGPPTSLPAAAEKGQSQAASKANPNSAVVGGQVGGRPVDPGSSSSAGAGSKKPEK